MNRFLKRTLGRCLIRAAITLPGARGLLRPVGLRTPTELFAGRTVSIPISRGRVLRLSRADESYLSFQLFWHGVDYYEPLTRAFLANLLRPGDTFLDIGAHVGFFALTTAISSPGIKSVAFEPNPKNFQILRANAAANGLSALVCEPLALSDQNGTATLYLTESDMSASLMKDFQAEDTQQIGRTEVVTVSLDAYVQQHALAPPFVIKVDIEGHEPAFFRGAVETIAAAKPDLILEVLYEQDGELVSWLKSLGYHFYPITDEGLVELDAPRLVKRFPFLFLNHLLSVRPKSALAALFERVRAATSHINLLQTSKHFPPEQWPVLWQDKTSQIPHEAAYQG